jgi:threonine/homoserine/homoserine lactone efflux protein
VLGAVLQAAGLGFSAAASPGPLQAVLLERAAARGPRRALPLALVPLVSDPLVILACLFALAGLPPAFLRGLRILGGALLCWMGAAGLRDLLRPAGQEGPAPVAEEAAGRAEAARPVLGFWRAALVNLLNPNAWLFWSLVGGPLLAAALREGAAGAALFLLAFYLPLTATNAALVVAFGSVGRLGPRAARTLGGISAAAFLALGLLQLLGALQGL